MAAKCWLWPNRIINKTFSGKLREEHNEAVNEHNIMRRALENVKVYNGNGGIRDVDGQDVIDEIHEIANDAIKRLKP